MRALWLCLALEVQLQTRLLDKRPNRCASSKGRAMELKEYGLVLASSLNPEYVDAYNVWQRRNASLPRRLERFLEEVQFTSTIDTHRLKLAVGGHGFQNRVGLVFSAAEQQAEFAAEFSDLMTKTQAGPFSLVGTGTSFQGFSTNPAKTESWKFGDGELDLDLQIYCPRMTDWARTEGLSLFPNMFVYEHAIEPRKARLSTFRNYTAPLVRGLDVFAPWIKIFELEWASQLHRTYNRACSVHIALMNFDTIPEPQAVMGSPFELIRAVEN